MKRTIIYFVVAMLSIVAALGGGEKANVPGTQIAKAQIPPNECNGDGKLTSGNDTYIGDDHDEICDGLGGDDNMAGRGGADYYTGGNGSDYLQGDQGPDILKGEGGHNNRVYGNNGNDELRAQNGYTDDRLDGGLDVNDCYGDVDDSSGARDTMLNCNHKFWNHIP